MMRTLVWCDMEMTGTDRDHDHIMEVAVARAPIESPTQAEFVLHEVVWLSDEALAGMQHVPRGMHTRNGLIDECRSSGALHLYEVEQRLLELFPAAPEEPDRYVLAGSSIHFDRGFIERWMPEFDRRLWRRHLDVSSVEIWCMSEGMEPLPRPDLHRATEDVAASIRRLELCREWMVDAFRLPGSIVRGAPRTE